MFSHLIIRVDTRAYSIWKKHNSGAESTFTAANVTTSGDATIAVVIGSSGDSKFYIKETTSSWEKYSKLWKKGTNGWVEVDPYEELDSTKKYILKSI